MFLFRGGLLSRSNLASNWAFSFLAVSDSPEGAEREPESANPHGSEEAAPPGWRPRSSAKGSLVPGLRAGPPRSSSEPELERESSDPDSLPPGDGISRWKGRKFSVASPGTSRMSSSVRPSRILTGLASEFKSANETEAPGGELGRCFFFSWPRSAVL